MNKAAVAVLKGTSGTGKGTRVVQLIKYLETKFKSETVHFTHKDKKRQLGIKFPEIGVVFIGMIVTSNKSGLASWTSMDYIHSTVGGVHKVPELLAPLFEEGLTVVAEGEPMMQSNRWRPEWMNETYGLVNFFFQYYHYEGNREAYDGRIVGRSGKVAGDAGWVREDAYAREFLKVNDELMELGGTKMICPASGETDLMGLPEGDRHSKNLLSLFDEPVHIWGMNLLHWLELYDHTKPFAEFAEKKPMLRDVNGHNPLATTKRLW